MSSDSVSPRPTRTLRSHVIHHNVTCDEEPPPNHPIIVPFKHQHTYNQSNPQGSHT